MVGVALGLTGAYFGAQAIESVLFGVHPRDPAVFAGTSVLLLGVALLSTLLPATRASRIDPARAIRIE